VSFCVWGGGVRAAFVGRWLEGLVIMRIVERFEIKSHPDTKPDKQGRSYVTLHPASLRGIDPGTLVSITNTRNGKRIFCMIKTDVDLNKSQIGIDCALQRKLDIEMHKDNKDIILAIVSQPMAYYVPFWMSHPNERVRVPLVVGTGIAFVALAISLLLLGF